MSRLFEFSNISSNKEMKMEQDKTKGKIHEENGADSGGILC